MREIAIIGLGFVADLYLSSLSAHPDIIIKALCDKDPVRRSRFLAHWQKKLPNQVRSTIIVTEDLETFVGALSPGNVVLNLTNPGAHFEVTQCCLAAGLHVWSEKPLAMSMTEAEALYNQAKDAHLILATAPCSVLGAAAQTMIASITEERAGPPRLVYAELDDGFISQAPTDRWASVSGAPWPYVDELSVGCTLEHAGYWLAWLIAAFGPIRTVVAASANTVPNTLPPEHTAAADISVGVLFFECGLVARLTCSIVAGHDHRMRVICDNGSLEVDAAWDNAASVRFRRRFPVRRRLVEHPFPKKLRLAGKSHPMVTNKAGAPMNFMLGPLEVLDARDEDRPCRLGGDYALHLTEAALALQYAGETNGSYAMTTRCEAMAPMPWAKLRA